MDSITFHHSPGVSIHACISHPAIVQHKPLLVFLHYWGGSSSTWYKLTSPDSPTSLSASYPTLAIDHRGWGKSTGPSQDGNTAYSISSMAKDVALVLQQLAADQDRKDALKHGFILIGHSMGAKVAMATLTTLPRDLLNCLKGLVLVAPAPATPLLLPPEMREQQKAAYQNAESVRWSLNHILANPENLDEKDIEMVVRDSLRGNELAKSAWPTYGMAEDVSDALQRALESMDREKLRVNILVGESDVVEPKDRVDKEVRRFLERSGIQVSMTSVPGVKHLLPLECPEALLQEISKFS
ncbi:alpha/beta fold hydrolase [Aspergillus novofumigatus IBT 16806]|uniref:Putative alpha/beta fold family hydrolase n=1 Tax=Aspergillus novofumigatus (strain IBT 16806) TaxID=1392255 RepID=A0A2I1CJW9_ASPN1|nr:putative alpha/beta fold family hydrolase [Aspergillus novofumigatus IBT 16806]PKX97919.1 putative alpha/beta fold family hydrolase [Aspergillus novofumigatus IBT 16806]